LIASINMVCAIFVYYLRTWGIVWKI